MAELYKVENSDYYDYMVVGILGKCYLGESYLHKVVDSFDYPYEALTDGIRSITLEDHTFRAENIAPLQVVKLIVSELIPNNRLGFVWCTKPSAVPQTKLSIYTDLNEYLHSNVTNYGCMLLGVRRTGKTTMMFQAMKQLYDEQPNRQDIIYIRVIKDSIDGFVLNDYLNALIAWGFKYIFVDEISYITEDFTRATMSIESSGNTKIIMTAADSLVLRYASNNVLFGRCRVIKTNYIPYNDFNSIAGGTSVIDYIKCGGILNPDNEYLKTHDMEAYTKNYMNTAIIDNIIGCFDRFDLDEKYPALSTLDEEQFRSLFYKWSEKFSSALVLRTLNRNIKLGDLIISMNNLGIKITYEQKEMMIESFKSNNSLVDFNGYTEQMVKEATWLMEELGCLVTINTILKENETALLVPVILKYGWTERVLSSVSEQMASILGDEMTTQVKYELLCNIEEVVQGSIIEEIVRYELFRKGRYLGKLRIRNDIEVDIIDTDGNFYEVKRSKEISLLQCRWLVDKEVLEKNPRSLNLLTMCSEEKDIQCSERDIVEEMIKYRKESGVVYDEKDIQALLDNADIIPHVIHCRNIDKFLAGL